MCGIDLATNGRLMVTKTVTVAKNDGRSFLIGHR